MIKSSMFTPMPHFLVLDSLDQIAIRAQDLVLLGEPLINYVFVKVPGLSAVLVPAAMDVVHAQSPVVCKATAYTCTAVSGDD